MEKPFPSLTVESRQVVERIRTLLISLGCENFVEADSRISEWLGKAFPNWMRREVFPYCLPQSGGFVPLLSSKLSSPVVALFSEKVLFAVNDHESLLPLRKRHLLMIGKDSAGSYLALDTSAKSGWNVCLIDTAEFLASHRWVGGRDYVLSFGKDLAQFLKWLRDDPQGFLSSWRDSDKAGGHYLSPPAS